MKNLLRICKSEWREMVSAVLLSGASLGAAVGLLATSAWLISMASTRPPVLVLEVAIVSVRFFGLSRGALKYGSRIVEHNSALKIQSALRVRIYEKLSRMAPTEYAQLHRGNFLSRVINDVELAQDLWLRVASPWFAAIISGVSGVTIIHWLLPSCGYVIGLIFLATSFVIPLLAVLSSGSVDSRQNESALFDQIVQIAESAAESLIFNYDQDLLAQIRNEQRKIEKVESRNARRSGFASAFYFLALGGSIIAALWFASDGALRHQLAGINIAVIALLPLVIFDGMSSLPAAFSQLRQILGAISQIDPLIQSVESDILRDESFIEGAITLELKELLPLIPGAHTQRISAQISSGQTLLITGRSGSGKSSIINSILGFAPHSGEILLNGRQLSLSDSHLFSTLLQDDYLFGTSIRENLKIGNPEASDIELFAVLALVELDDFVVNLPESLNTMVGPLGYNFSGGEKQRLRLARLLLRNTPIFILDEPYEFLDAQMVERVSRRVSEKFSDRVVIIVSHLPLPISSLSLSLT